MNGVSIVKHFSKESCLAWSCMFNFSLLIKKEENHTRTSRPNFPPNKTKKLMFTFSLKILTKLPLLKFILKHGLCLLYLYMHPPPLFCLFRKPYHICLYNICFIHPSIHSHTQKFYSSKISSKTLLCDSFYSLSLIYKHHGKEFLV